MSVPVCHRGVSGEIFCAYGKGGNVFFGISYDNSSVLAGKVFRRQVAVLLPRDVDARVADNHDNDVVLRQQTHLSVRFFLAMT